MHFLYNNFSIAAGSDRDGLVKQLIVQHGGAKEKIQAWDVLSTLTPSEYSQFRPALGRSSGSFAIAAAMMRCMSGSSSGRRLTRSGVGESTTSSCSGAVVTLLAFT